MIQRGATAFTIDVKTPRCTLGPRCPVAVSSGNGPSPLRRRALSLPGEGTVEGAVVGTAVPARAGLSVWSDDIAGVACALWAVCFLLGASPLAIKCAADLPLAGVFLCGADPGDFVCASRLASSFPLPGEGGGGGVLLLTGRAAAAIAPYNPLGK